MYELLISNDPHPLNRAIYVPAECGASARETVTAADPRGAGIGAVVASANTTAVEPFSAVGAGERPLANDEPERRGGVAALLVAYSGDVLCLRHLVLCLRKDLMTVSDRAPVQY